MISERELINRVHESVVTKFPDIVTRGPFTTMYWDSTKNDNQTQQKLTVIVGNQKFEVLVREVK